MKKYRYMVRRGMSLDEADMYLAEEVEAREAQHIAIDRAQKAKIAELEKALQIAKQYAYRNQGGWCKVDGKVYEAHDIFESK